MKSSCLFLGAILAWICAVRCRASTVELDLGGSSWTVTSSNGSVQVPATVPGVVHTDLLAAGVIGDPYFRFNDDLQQWISLDSWTYKRSFSIDKSLLVPGTSAQLVMKGIQTVARVFLNGELVAEVSNMFHEHYISIPRSILSAENNNLVLLFESTVTYAAMQQAAYPYDVPLNPEYITTHGFPNRQYVRTSQASFGWDWGPGFAAVGIYRPIKLIFYSTPRIQRSMVYSYPTNPHSLCDWIVYVRVVMDIPDGFSHDNALQLSVSCLGKTNTSTVSAIVSGNEIVADAFLLVTGPVALWWPVGFGSPALHDVTISLSSPSSSDVFDTVTKRTGFRLTVLDTSKARDSGSLFGFVINNVRIFAKGANYVPADAFQSPSRINATFLNAILDAAVNANMNMIRVWGGGIFEDDCFYDAADEKGLMVWEEFKFACALVPRDPAFLASVQREISDQVFRLARHPSIVVYGGNNENQLTLDWTVAAQLNSKLYATDYNVLYADTLPITVFNLDHTRPFWPSSPSNGYLVNKPEEGWVVLSYGDGNSASEGDVHFYTYETDCTDVTIFPKPRFASEFGFQSYPSMQSWSSVSIPSDLFTFSPLMDHRQHHPSGNAQLVTAISILFPYQQNETSFSSFVWLGQLLQGVCMRSESEHYRRLRGTDASTAGTLYWQLNNNWQAPSWSSLEYGNAWKLGHYFARRFYAPVLVSPVVVKAVLSSPSDGKEDAATAQLFSADFEVWVLNDQTIALGQVYATILAFDWNGELLGSINSSIVSVDPLSSVLVWKQDLDQALRLLKCSQKASCFAQVELVDHSSHNVLSSNVQLFAAPKEIIASGDLRAPNLSVVVAAQLSPQTFTLHVSNAHGGVAMWATLSHAAIPGWLSDNVLPTVLPNTLTSLTFYADSPISIAELTASLSVTSLWHHIS
eukprot:ANDGO_02038.mRNA.1 Beta-mannosidase A